MPLTKNQAGWYWGLKGTYATKDNAQQVAQTAYATGYKQQKTDVISFRVAKNTWIPPSNLTKKFEQV
jgi:hypothetical protein